MTPDVVEDTRKAAEKAAKEYEGNAKKVRELTITLAAFKHDAELLKPGIEKLKALAEQQYLADMAKANPNFGPVIDANPLTDTQAALDELMRSEAHLKGLVNIPGPSGIMMQMPSPLVQAEELFGPKSAFGTDSPGYMQIQEDNKQLTEAMREASKAVQENTERLIRILINSRARFGAC